MLDKNVELCKAYLNGKRFPFLLTLIYRVSGAEIDQG